MKLKKGKLASILFGFRNPVGQVDLPEKSEDFHSGETVASDTPSSQSVADQLISKEIPKPSDQSGSASVVSVNEHYSDKYPVENQESEMISDNYDEHEEHRHIVFTYSKLQLAQCERQIENLMQVCPEAYGVLISTVDGHEVVHRAKRDLPIHKISTMNSSLLALGETIARESKQHLCQFVILENSDGRIVSLRINDLVMLTCISSKEVNLGMLLSIGRNAAGVIEQILAS